MPIRQAILLRAKNGATTTEISQAFDLSPRTVRNLLKRFRERGDEGLTPDYHRLPQPPPPPSHPAFAPAVLLRQAHPLWGAGLILTYLKLQGVGPLPCVRTLQQWFHRAGLGPPPPGRRPAAAAANPATAPHQVWQVDAAEEILLGDGTRVSWLRIVDEFTGAVLHTAIFPPREVAQRAREVHPGRTSPRVPTLGPAAGHPR
jgi:DNA-binding transcriptional ArsR family regulator